MSLWSETMDPIKKEEGHECHDTDDGEPHVLLKEKSFETEYSDANEPTKTSSNEEPSSSGLKT